VSQASIKGGSSIKHAEDTRERLLTAAAAIFAEHGFEAATVRDICQRAGANLAAVNYHFGDKERLYLETIKQAHRRRVEQVPLPEWPVGMPASEKLRGFILTTITRMVDEPNPQWQMQIMMRELMRPTQVCTELVQDFFRPHFELLLSILDELLPPDVSLERRHLVAFSIVGQCLYYRVARPVVKLLVGEQEAATYTTEQLAEHIAEFSLAALGVGAKQPIKSSSAKR
jgi:AcrR family transcriptional regulator